MTYLVVTPFFPTPGHFWGNFVYDQVKAIKKTKNYDDVIVLRAGTDTKPYTHYSYKGINVINLPFYSTPSRILDGLQDPLNVILFRKTLYKININLNQISVAHFHTSSLACLAVALKKLNPHIKTLLQHHDLDPWGINVGRLSDKKWNLLFKIKRRYPLYANIDSHVCISKACEENLLRFPKPREHEVYKPYLNKLAKLKSCPQPSIKRSVILYNGVDTSIFYRKESVKHIGFRIGCIGRFIDLKDQMTLIKALEQLKDVIPGMQGIFIGDGPLLDECKQYVNNHQLNDVIEFEKTRMPDKLADFYNSLDLFVLPSVFEGFGCTFTEAYACGVPFMSCRYQGIEDLLPEEEKSKWLINGKDWKQLSHLIFNYWKNKYKQNLIKPYDIDTLINLFLEEI